MATQTLPQSPLQILLDASLSAWRRYRIGWAPGKKNSEYDAWQEALKKVDTEKLRLLEQAKEAGLQLGAGYAYNPHQHGSSNGGYHITVLVDSKVGRAERKANDALCKPARKFWGLDRRPLDINNLPTCPKCLSALEKLLAAAPTKEGRSYE